MAYSHSHLKQDLANHPFHMCQLVRVGAFAVVLEVGPGDMSIALVLGVKWNLQLLDRHSQGAWKQFDKSVKLMVVFLGDVIY